MSEKNEDQETPEEELSEEQSIPEDDDVVEVSPEDAEKLKKFIQENTNQKDEDGDDEGESEEDVETPEDFPEIPRDRIFDPYDDSFSTVDELPAIDGIIEITDADKENYLRAMLNDDPVILTISLCNGEVNVKIRARTAWEQSLVYEAIYQDQEMKIVNEYRQGVIQLQKYSASLMIQSVNGRPFSATQFVKKPDTDIQADIDKLKEITHSKIENLDSAKLTLILNALRIFEFKLAKISTQCMTGNFWNPAD